MCCIVKIHPFLSTTYTRKILSLSIYQLQVCKIGWTGSATVPPIVQQCNLRRTKNAQGLDWLTLFSQTSWVKNKFKYIHSSGNLQLRCLLVSDLLQITLTDPEKWWTLIFPCKQTASLQFTQLVMVKHRRQGHLKGQETVSVVNFLTNLMGERVGEMWDFFKLFFFFDFIIFMIFFQFRVYGFC